MTDKDRKRTFSVDSLEQVAFTLVIPLVVLACILGFVTHMTGNYESTSTITTIVIVFCQLSLIGLYIFGMITKQFALCYPVSCVIIAGICVPALFLLNGGFYSGMPIFILAVSVLCCLCSDNRARLTVFCIAQAADAVVFYLAIRGKAAQLDFNTHYFNYDIIINYVISAVCIFITFHLFMRAAKRFENGTDILKDYVDEQVADTLLKVKEQEDEEVTGKLNQVTVLFADIDEFTSTAEKMSPQMATDYVNEFLEICDAAVYEHHGLLDKYIGDCAMAYWVDADGSGSGIEEAVRTALQIRNKLQEQGEEILNHFHVPLDFSAGLCYGPAVVGEVGSERRKAFTVMGDTVNTASRIQHTAGPGHILVSEKIAETLYEKMEFQQIASNIHVKGKECGLTLYLVEEKRQNH